MAMAANIAVTEDGERPITSEPGTPLLLLLFAGATALTEPQRIELPVGTTVIGRAVAENNGICLDDKRASRVHAIVQYEPRACQLRVADAGSRNGTFVNGA